MANWCRRGVLVSSFLLFFAACGPSEAERRLVGTWVVDTITVAEGAQERLDGDDADEALARALTAGVLHGSGLRYDFRANGSLEASTYGGGIRLSRAELHWKAREVYGDTALYLEVTGEHEVLPGNRRRIDFDGPDQLSFQHEDLVIHWRRR